jgi:hypothetical protein
VNIALLLVIMPVRGFGRYMPATSVMMSCGLAVQTIGLILAVRLAADGYFLSAIHTSCLLPSDRVATTFQVPGLKGFVLKLKCH